MLHNICFVMFCERKIIMPPKPKYTKEEIIKAALDMVREKGADSLTARDLGAKLNTSARPIFTAFENMEDLKNAATDAGVSMFKEYSKNFIEYTPAFKQMGMQIISFATKEPKLFEFLFMHKNPEAVHGLKTVEDTCVEVISKDYDLNYTCSDKITLTASYSLSAAIASPTMSDGICDNKSADCK